jgi:5-methylcytosine-specific restriction endonuclease McrA
MHAEGLVKVYRGPDNPNWKGGPKACMKRRIADGRAAECVRRYRQNNPDKVREFTQRRAGRKLDKLPYGTIPKLRTAQGDKCAICCTKLKGKGHVDHIVPLARGGRHAPRNLQILCPPCNLHKSDRDPIAHMQSLGRLL